MPELPEVETVRRSLSPALGAQVTEVWTSGQRLHSGRAAPRGALARAARGARLEGVDRIGKYLILRFEGREEGVLIHLGMTGRLRVEAPEAPADPHVHLRLELQLPGGGRAQLRFRDPRRFGRVGTVARGEEHQHPALAGLGPDPLLARAAGDPAGELAAALRSALRQRRAPVKAILLDQRAVAGLGNIYACEALWEARIHPRRPGGRVGPRQAEKLAAGVLSALDRALSNGGTSLRDFVDGDGNEGGHAPYLRVYGRAGEPCPRCRARIARAPLQGRATFFCARCQRGPRG